jgi:hypothetical protein
LCKNVLDDHQWLIIKGAGGAGGAGEADAGRRYCD